MNQRQTQEPALSRIVKELKKIDSTRLGRIVRIEEPTDSIWVDYENNPTQEPLPARLANGWIGFEDLQEAMKRKATVQVDFEQGNPLKPVIRDIFYSISSLKKQTKQAATKQVIRIEGDEIVLSARKKIIVESGNVRTTYLAEGGELITEADQIDTYANKNQKLKGRNLFFN